MKNVTSQLRHFEKPKKKHFAAEKTDESLRFLYEYKVKLCIAEVAPMRELLGMA